MNTVTTDPVPIVYTTVRELQDQSRHWHAQDLIVGMVPTMGALHAGHESLIRRAKSECDRVIVTIFVNPTQFGPTEDYDRYPRSFESDRDLCRRHGVDAIFAPRVEEMYPRGYATTVLVSGSVTSGFEAQARPHHFAGVTTVVSKLWWAGEPQRCYFGLKDAQQCAVVRRLASDLCTGIEIVTCPVVRDADGLALSSRNQYLSPEQRNTARLIPKSLQAVYLAYSRGERGAEALCGVARDRLADSALELDYVAVVDPETFLPRAEAELGNQFLVAATIGGIRLIDAIRLGVDTPPEGEMAGVVTGTEVER